MRFFSFLPYLWSAKNCGRLRLRLNRFSLEPWIQTKEASNWWHVTTSIVCVSRRYFDKNLFIKTTFWRNFTKRKCGRRRRTSLTIRRTFSRKRQAVFFFVLENKRPNERRQTRVVKEKRVKTRLAKVERYRERMTTNILKPMTTSWNIK